MTDVLHLLGFGVCIRLNCFNKLNELELVRKLLTAYFYVSETGKLNQLFVTITFLFRMFYRNSFQHEDLLILERPKRQGLLRLIKWT